MKEKMVKISEKLYDMLIEYFVEDDERAIKKATGLPVDDDEQHEYHMTVLRENIIGELKAKEERRATREIYGEYIRAVPGSQERESKRKEYFRAMGANPKYVSECESNFEAEQEKAFEKWCEEQETKAAEQVLEEMERQYEETMSAMGNPLIY